ncbi:MAG: hypothetical protein KGS61_20500, partial [Verrucomicrobia bacterium]|nr:hypothetical protein [Verrucomicrobiota bacterium]
MNWALLRSSLAVSALSTVLAVVFGLAAALWLAGLDRRWRTALLALSAVALALPPFLVTNFWLDVLGFTGRWHRWFPLNIYSLGGTVWILALLTWPITLFLALGAWLRLDSTQLECDPALCGWPLVRWLLLPLARPALTQAAALTFALTLNNFAVPSILQVKVFPAELWVSFNTQFDYGAALELSWPLVIVPLSLLLWFRRRQVAWPQLDGGVASARLRRQLGRGWFGSSATVTIGALLTAVGFPLAQLMFANATWSELPAVWATGRGVLLHSFGYAAITATLCIGLALAGRRWRIGLILWIPFLVPGVLLGIALIFLFNRPLLAWLYQSVGIVILALTV